MSFFRISNNLWKFSKINDIEESDFNKNLESFYKLSVSGVTKENIQNSLDGRLLNNDLPVVVKIRLGTISTKDIPGINEVIERINSLKGRNKYVQETIDHMLKKTGQKNVNYVSFEDLNTKGLSGAKNGNSNSKDDTWGIYAYNKGVHYENDDNEFETTRGGSHGIGKIASNAASDLHLMFFSNCDENGDQHIGGTVQLIEHKYKGQCYRNTGYFTDIKRDSGNEKYYPYENNYGSIFKKKTRGLKIVIPYLKEENYDEKKIIKSVCDNFFIAVLESRLVVDINSKVINAETISNYISDNNYYEQDISNMSRIFTPLYLKTYQNKEPRELVVNNIARDYNFKLYFNYDENIKRGRVAIIRTIGMKIEDFIIRGNATKPFNAVLIGGIDEDGYLKTLENASHMKITHDHIRDKKLKRQATRFIQNLSKEIVRIIEEEINKHNMPDGKMDTSDLLYVVENQLKQDLKNTFGSVKAKKNKNVVKVASQVTIRRNPGKKTGPVHPKGTGITRKGRKVIPGLDNKREKSTETYRIKPHTVERIIADEEEFILINFKNYDEIKNASSVNLSFKIIDGMGKEYTNEFEFKDNYYSIVDRNLNTNLSFTDEKIKGISVKDGMILLLLSLKPSYNRGLKFVYYVEV